MDCSVMVMPCLVNSKIPQVQGKDVRRSFSRVKYVVHLLLLLDFNFPVFGFLNFCESKASSYP